MISTNNLHFSYGKKNILEGINLQIPQGSIYGYLGKNGAGKSTTIKLLLGLLPLNKQKIVYNDKEFLSHRTDILRKIGCMVETPSLYAHFTCYEQLQYTDIFFKMGKKRIEEILQLVGLYNDRHKKIKHCSTGMKQRLAIGTALFHNPEILILDEPTNGLDPAAIYDIRKILCDLHAQEKTIFISSHILSEIEKTCTHVGIIDKGKLLYQGTMTDLLAASKRRVTIWADAICKATSIFTANNIKIIREEKNSIELIIENDQQFNKAIKLLVENNIEIQNLDSHSDDLEHIFINLTSSDYANKN